MARGGVGDGMARDGVGGEVCWLFCVLVSQ